MKRYYIVVENEPIKTLPCRGEKQITIITSSNEKTIIKFAMYDKHT